VAYPVSLHSDLLFRWYRHINNIRDDAEWQFHQEVDRSTVLRTCAR